MMHELLQGLPASDRHPDGYRPVHRACWGNKKEHALTARQLIVKGKEDVNARSDDGLTPLLLAASAGALLSLPSNRKIIHHGGNN